MLTGVGSIAVLVRDTKKAAAWYRDYLGFEIIGDVAHSVYVRPRGAAGPLIHLCGRCDSWEADQPGGRTGIWLQCGEITTRKDPRTGQVLPASNPEEVERTYLELRKRGVEFSEELTTTDWGKYAILRDPDGNLFEIS